jgi:hypothetical protein
MGMHFSTKSYLKSNRNHTAKQTLHMGLTIPSVSCVFVHQQNQMLFKKDF